MRELLSLLGHTPENNGAALWFERDEGDARLAYDRAFIAYDYPFLKYGLNFRLRQVFLSGVIVLRAECGIPTRIKTSIVFPDAYPEHEPLAYEVGNKFDHDIDRHFYRNGRCCIWLDAESEWKPHDPSALLNFLHQVSFFFERQLIYDADPQKRWAWGGRGHGIDGYIEFVQETLGGASLADIFMPLLSGKEAVSPNSACLCGSKRKFKNCHEKQIGGLIRRLGEYNPFAVSKSTSSASVK